MERSAHVPTPAQQKEKSEGGGKRGNSVTTAQEYRRSRGWTVLREKKKTFSTDHLSWGRHCKGTRRSGGNGGARRKSRWYSQYLPRGDHHRLLEGCCKKNQVNARSAREGGYRGVWPGSDQALVNSDFQKGRAGLHRNRSIGRSQEREEGSVWKGKCRLFDAGSATRVYPGNGCAIQGGRGKTFLKDEHDSPLIKGEYRPVRKRHILTRKERSISHPCKRTCLHQKD